MDALLVSVTVISLTLAAGMGVLLFRLMREERLRSEARVQLLEELAAGGGEREHRHSVRAEAVTLPQPEVPSFLRSSNVPAAARTEPAATGRRIVTDLPLRDEPTAPVEIGVHELFHDEHKPSPWPRRLAVIGSLAAVLTMAVFGWNQIRGSVATSDTPSLTTAAEVPLELMSLRHSRQGNTLTVTGLVQNPKGATALSNVQATVFVFGPGGTFITSGRAPLDFTSLASGDESPFVIRVPVSGNVARYRVGFRSADDRVVAHVDRRADQLGRSF